MMWNRNVNSLLGCNLKHNFNFFFFNFWMFDVVIVKNYISMKNINTIFPQMIEKKQV